MNILVVGAMGSGKGVVASHLINKYGYKEYHMSSYLKNMVHDHYNLKSDVSKGKVINGKTVRQYYQEFGMKLREIDIDWHIDEIKKKLTEPFVISDIRFPNEINKISDKFECKIILITTTETERIARLCLRDSYVPSERELRDPSELHIDLITNVDYTLTNNGSINDLKRKVDEIIYEI